MNRTRQPTHAEPAQSRAKKPRSYSPDWSEHAALYRDIVFIAFTGRYFVAGIPGQSFETLDQAIAARDFKSMNRRMRQEAKANAAAA